eukprot:2215960-Rhodomonas_salina.3
MGGLAEHWGTLSFGLVAQRERDCFASWYNGPLQVSTSYSYNGPLQVSTAYWYNGPLQVSTAPRTARA